MPAHTFQGNHHDKPALLGVHPADYQGDRREWCTSHPALDVAFIASNASAITYTVENEDWAMAFMLVTPLTAARSSWCAATALRP
jgi:hypothetical protein